MKKSRNFFSHFHELHGSWRTSLVQELLYLATITKLLELAWMWNSGNHSVGQGVCSASEHPSIARWTVLQISSTRAAQDVAYWTRGDGNISGDQETHGALKLLQETFKSRCCCHYHFFIFNCLIEFQQ